MRAGRPMAEIGFRATGEHGRHPPPFPREQWMPNGEDAAVDPVEAARLHSVADSAFAQPDRNELMEGDDTVLLRCEPRDLRLDRPNPIFRTHTVRFVGFADHAPTVTPPGMRFSPLLCRNRHRPRTILTHPIGFAP